MFSRKNINKYIPILLLVALSLIFFVMVSAYSNINHSPDYIKFSSPDENANYIFSKIYSQTGEMTIFEKYNKYAGELLHPRSYRSDLGVLKPVSFPGIIIIYGKIASLSTIDILPYLTPLFACIGVLFFYLFIKRIFGQRNALLSSVILLSFPVYIYYSARSMFHNVLFTVFLIIGLYFLTYIKRTKKKFKFFGKLTKEEWKSLVLTALAGTFIGLAIITRTSELIWLAPILFLMWIFNIQRVGIVRLIVFLSFLSIATLPMVYWNQILYGSIISGGYVEINQSLAGIAETGEGILQGGIKSTKYMFGSFVNSVIDFIFYFGFHPYQSMTMFFHYFTEMFWWIFYPACIGGLIFLSKIKLWKRKHLVYLLSLIVLSFVLVLYYGSWRFTDNPNPNSFTIGNSYTRYWLPIYLGALPFVSMFLIRFSKVTLSSIKPKRLKNLSINGLQIILVSLIFYVSIFFVLFGSEEGLWYTTINNRFTKQEVQKVLELTESDSVIITQYHDKVLFPERKVIVGLFTDDNMNRYYGKIVKHLPTYYYNFKFPEKDLRYLNERRLPNFGLNIEMVEVVNKDFALYRLTEFVPEDNIEKNE